MNDTCNSAQKENRLIDASVNGVVHSIFFHHHLHNVWVNNTIDSLTDFLRAHINDSLEGVAPVLRVFIGFISLTRAFEKSIVSVQTTPRVFMRYFVNG